jgi:hypothetical protein
MMHDLRDVSDLSANVMHLHHVDTTESNTYSKPMCEWMTRRAQKMESATGLSDPAAKGARVKGMMPAEMILSWYVSLALTIPL